MSLNNEIDEIRNKYNEITGCTYKILMCKFATSCCKGKTCNYCHKGEKQNKTRKVKFYEYIIKNKLVDHIKNKFPYVKIICNHCDNNLKSLEYVNKQQLRFREKIAMFCNYKDIDWIVDFTEEYFRRRVVCYRHIKSFYDDSVVCTGGINCCFGNHDLIYENGYDHDKKDTINKFTKSIIEKLSSDLKKYADIISKDFLENKEKEKILDYISELKKSILEYSNWINDSNQNNINYNSRSTSSKDNKFRILHNFDSDYKTSSDHESDTDLDYSSSEEYIFDSAAGSCIKRINPAVPRRSAADEEENEIVNEMTSLQISLDDSFDDNIYSERSKSVRSSKKKEPTKIIRKSKSFSCPKDLLKSTRSNNLNRYFMTNIDDSITQILEKVPEGYDDYLESFDFDVFDDGFYSIDRSLISPATANWIKDFRKSKTPESRHISSSPYCESLTTDFFELHQED